MLTRYRPADSRPKALAVSLRSLPGEAMLRLSRVNTLLPCEALLAGLGAGLMAALLLAI